MNASRYSDSMNVCYINVLPLLSCSLAAPHLSLQCFECHIIFSDYKSKKRHMKLSHPRQYEQHLLRDALFACYVCDRHFTNSSELMAHQKSHTEKKPFKCPLCDQAFMKSSELTRHKKKHFGQDGYACTECGKPCKTLTLLKYHRRTHTGERPYVCKECGKRFTMAKALTKHALTHLPEGAEEEGNPKAKVLQNKTDGMLQMYHFTCYDYTLQLMAFIHLNLAYCIVSQVVNMKPND